MIPIKLLNNGAIKRNLLQFIGETPNIDMDDYLESRIQTVDRARKLMAIEDASEIAKKFLQAPGVFESISDDILKETGKTVSFNCRKTRNMKKRKSGSKKEGTEYLQMVWTAGGNDDSGHYGMARINHDEKTAIIYDSMVNEGSPFENALKATLARTYKIRTSKKGGAPQPTGGDVKPNVNSFRNAYPFKNDQRAQLAFEISQYDELSQHHFCYIESFIAMMVDLGIMKPGPKDPRDRLPFIKRVVWALVHKYTPETMRGTAQWNYFIAHFPYIMETRTNGKRLSMRGGKLHIPPANGVVTYTVRKLNLPVPPPARSLEKTMTLL